MASRTIEALYREHGHVVLRRARRILGNEEDAREVLHDVFVSFIDRPDAFRGQSSITTWLYSATTHACLNRLRNQRTRARLLTEGYVAPERSTAGGAESTAVLRDLLARVPVELAQVAIYFYADEMTHEEIARVLGCSRRHVGDLVERLRASLRKIEEVT